MLVLVTKSQPETERMSAELGGYVGRLLTPRHYNSLDRLVASGLAWAADNDAYSGFDEPAFLAMLAAIEGRERCLFVTCPDVVGDADATTALWRLWRPRIERTGLPAAYVLQDGLERPDAVPAEAEAVFVGGSTDYKLASSTARIVTAMREQGRHVHMGRVNSVRRIRYAASIGCDSVDGTQWVRFTDRKKHLLHGLPYVQGRLG